MAEQNWILLAEKKKNVGQQPAVFFNISSQSVFVVIIICFYVYHTVLFTMVDMEL